MNAIMTIAMEVSRIRGVALNDLLSDRRPVAIVRPRQEAMYLAKTMTPASLPAIGRRLGGRDHTTVLHGVRKISERIADVPGYGDELEAMQAAIRAKLPKPEQMALVPYGEVDATGSADRIMKDVGASRTVEIYAEEVVAIAAALLDAQKRIADLDAQLLDAQLLDAQCKPQSRSLTIDPPAPPSVKLPKARRPEMAPLVTQVRAAIAAFTKLQADRFTPAERYSQQALDRRLTTLKETIEEKDATR